MSNQFFILPPANAGYFFPPPSFDGDEPTTLECAVCRVTVEVARFCNERPIDVHRELNADCPLVRCHDGGNVVVAQIEQQHDTRQFTVLYPNNVSLPPLPRSSTANPTPNVPLWPPSLPVISKCPARPNMAVPAKRLDTFEGWTLGEFHPPREMVEAGFYYTGHADLVRCFYCKGGIKSWKRFDRPWVEHGRWFPKCPFVRLCKGQEFVDVVQKLIEVSDADVKREIGRWLLALSRSDSPSDEGAGCEDEPQQNIEEVCRKLEEENDNMKKMTLCKICLTREVQVLFLPCFHLVSCGLCAPALRCCAICRRLIEGIARVTYPDR